MLLLLLLQSLSLSLSRLQNCKTAGILGNRLLTGEKVSGGKDPRAAKRRRQNAHYHCKSLHLGMLQVFQGTEAHQKDDLTASLPHCRIA